MMIKSNTLIWQSRSNMEVFTLKEWEDNFDNLFARVENGETIGIVREDGQAAVMMPADEADFIRIHTEENNDAD